MSLSLSLSLSFSLPLSLSLSLSLSLFVFILLGALEWAHPSTPISTLLFLSLYLPPSSSAGGQGWVMDGCGRNSPLPIRSSFLKKKFNSILFWGQKLLQLLQFSTRTWFSLEWLSTRLCIWALPSVPLGLYWARVHWPRSFHSFTLYCFLIASPDWLGLRSPARALDKPQQICPQIESLHSLELRVLRSAELYDQGLSEML